MHIHIYGSRRKAAALEMYHLEVLEDEAGPAGPHPEAQVGLIATDEQLRDLNLSYIAEEYGVSILVHPIMEDEVRAHSDEAVWWGEEVQLNLEFFAQNGIADLA